MDLARREDAGIRVRCDEASLPSLFCLGLNASVRSASPRRFRLECGLSVVVVVVLALLSEGVLAELGKKGLGGVTGGGTDTSGEGSLFVESDSFCCLLFNSLIAALMFIGAPPYRLLTGCADADADNGVECLLRCMWS